MHTHQLISEPITPITESLKSSDQPGQPALPERFLWREKEYAIDEVLSQGHGTGPCRNGAAESYVRKHWFLIRTTDGVEMKIYFLRNPRNKSEKRGWWLYTAAME